MLGGGADRMLEGKFVKKLETQEVRRRSCDRFDGSAA
jgi:hypothetical protein